MNDSMYQELTLKGYDSGPKIHYIHKEAQSLI